MSVNWLCLTCADKGKVQTSEESIKIPAKGHTPTETVKKEETAAVCIYEGGYDLITKCSDCHEVLKEESVVTPADPDAHIWGKWEVTTPATEQKEGVETRVCYLCKKQETRAIDPTGQKSKQNNSAVVKGKTVKLKAKKLRKKAQNIARNKAIYLSNAQGAVTFAKGTVTYKKAKSVRLNKKKLKKYKKSLKKKFVVNKNTGRITAKKGLKKGIYKLKVQVNCAGNESYEACTKTVTVTIKVR